MPHHKPVIKSSLKVHHSRDHSKEEKCYKIADVYIRLFDDQLLNPVYNQFYRVWKWNQEIDDLGTMPK